MTYIRTKDDIYEVNQSNYTIVDGFTTVNALHKNIIGIRTNSIIKQADTIEELCDEFVVAGLENHRFMGIDFIRENYSAILWDIYGAIWTAKGLIYVAKMNDKGELELL